ncbi:O-acetylhomoserine (thiol)-lyase [Termitomyces sp. J132]|nr:O-acetylhomoserine (thiol)-lyase [Termitomyces sp. J132]
MGVFKITSKKFGIGQHPQIAWVRYLGLPNHESHELALKTLRPGVFSGMFSFGYKGDAQQTHRLVDNLKLVSNLANVRDAKTLVIHPAMMTHLQLTEEEQRETGVEHNALNHDIKEFKHKMIIVETEANNNEVKKAQLEAQLQEVWDHKEELERKRAKMSFIPPSLQDSDCQCFSSKVNSNKNGITLMSCPTHCRSMWIAFLNLTKNISSHKKMCPASKRSFVNMMRKRMTTHSS